jgi:hypothetical protein
MTIELPAIASGFVEVIGVRNPSSRNTFDLLFDTSDLLTLAFCHAIRRSSYFRPATNLKDSTDTWVPNEKTRVWLRASSGPPPLASSSHRPAYPECAWPIVEFVHRTHSQHGRESARLTLRPGHIGPVRQCDAMELQFRTMEAHNRPLLEIRVQAADILSVQLRQYSERTNAIDRTA